MKTEEKNFPCSRCEGKGSLQAFSHVLGGVCLKCGGSGKQASNPKRGIATHLYAVFLPNQETGKAERIYNMRTRSSAEALRAAEEKFCRASAGFKDIYTLEGAVIVRADELDETEAPVLTLERAAENGH